MYFVLLQHLGFSAALALAAPVTVIHAEPPADNALARIIVARAVIQVDVNESGRVILARAREPRPPFVAGIAEEAARKWVFAPSPTPHREDITFSFEGVGLTDIQSYQQVIVAGEHSLRIRHMESVVEELRPSEKVALSQQRCPRHGTTLRIGLVPIRYGLPSSYAENDPALRLARKFWKSRDQVFPEANTFRGRGCTVQPQQFAETGYCQKCRRARASWLRAHPAAVAVE
jgi:hypothetical protein